MTTSTLDFLQVLYRQKSEKFFADFFKFLSFSSISSEPSYKNDVRNCVTWLKNYVEEMRFTCELWPTNGHPVLFGHWGGAGPDKPTLLIYNHYDVQPVDPLEEWTSHPFEPAVRDGKVYARGAQDNKGQCFYVLQALKILFERDGKLPLNIKLCIEGEEECGSHGLTSILSERKEQLKADYLAVVDLGIKSANEPSVTLGFRGLATMDVEFTGSNVDMHSGQHGGLVYNPLHALVETLAKLRDSNGRITVPGFYDEVVEIDALKKEELCFDFDANEYESAFSAKPYGGEKKFLPNERLWLRPTIEINGLHGGYCGNGFKTVIPAKAHAKISCRLVPDQSPEDTAKKTASFIQENAPNGIVAKVTVHPGGGVAIRSQASSQVVRSFAKALEEVYKIPCKFILSGASIPVISKLQEASGAEVVLLGLGLGSDRIHAPDEHFDLDRLEKGCLMMARGMELLGTLACK